MFKTGVAPSGAVLVEPGAEVVLSLFDRRGVRGPAFLVLAIWILLLRRARNLDLGVKLGGLFRRQLRTDPVSHRANFIFHLGCDRIPVGLRALVAFAKDLTDAVVLFGSQAELLVEPAEELGALNLAVGQLLGGPDGSFVRALNEGSNQHPGHDAGAVDQNRGKYELPRVHWSFASDVVAG